MIAPAGQWREQLLQCTPSVLTTQFSAIHTAWPICVADFSAKSARRMAFEGDARGFFGKALHVDGRRIEIVDPVGNGIID